MFSYSSNFWRLCLSAFFFTASYNLILPELNEFITGLGGKDYKGLIIALFTISGGLTRPFSGKLSDKIGRKKVMFVGIAVAITVSLLYPVSAGLGIWFFLLLRFLHGFCVGFFPTGATALVTDILPEKLRGSGMGLWGTFISLGIGVGMGLSSKTANLFGKDGLYFASAGFVCIALILLSRVEETLKETQAFRFDHLLIRKDEIIERNVIPAAIVMFLSSMCSGVIFVLSPEIADVLHIEDKGWFFIWYVISTIAMRLFAGGLSDKIGRRQTLVIGMSLLAISMLLIGLTNGIFWFTTSAVVFGLATGIASPSIFAWTADLSPSHRRGIGAGTMFIAMEAGVFTGSLVTNMIYTNEPSSIPNAFIFAGSMAAGCVVYLIWHLVKRQSVS